MGNTRATAQFGTRRDHATQFEALRLVYGWAVEAVGQMQAGYGSHLEVRISALGSVEERRAGFVVAIDGFAALAASVEEMKPGDDRWHVVLATHTAGADSWVAAEPDRRHSFWTRSRVEGVLLELLSALERTRSRPDRRSAGVAALSTR